MPRKTHWAHLEAETPVCGETNRPQLTHDQGAVTCGRCRRLLGIVPDELRNFIDSDLIARLVTPLPGDKALDSLLGRAFVGAEERINDLCTKARLAIADYDAHPNDPPAENMADLLRGFISALGRSE